MPGRFVRIRSSVAIARFLISMPDSLAPQSSMLALRPTESKIISASTEPFSPFLFSNRTFFPSSSVTFVPSMKVTFFSAFLSSIAICRSITGTISSIISMTVTLEPKEEKRLANSIPITPPPIMQRREGISATDSNPVESSTAGLSFMPGIGGTIGEEPVAMIIFWPLITRGNSKDPEPED